ncbi:glycoside hydrolase family 128 protein [Myriangium duriaei CBS 260.36]|uniref:Glycoside hydrolase family 128 protein n=1 Tax=Myriangium duriaei CBS 260.36 TaxID=1168546 RepID=A0A9P4JDY4_9PEZI|nr:glycoside hydrolase family 128 protein [Myriangium duriaei CBS 260.36]
MQPYAGRAALGAPAVTNGGPPIGTTWLGEFLGNCTGCQIDFINVHWYSNVYAGANYFESFINQTRAVAGGRPIWVTEFALDSTYAFTDAQNVAFLETVMTWMDAQPDVAAYAYFMDAPGLLLDKYGANATALGIAYDSYSGGSIKGGLAL